MSFTVMSRKTVRIFVERVLMDQNRPRTCYIQYDRKPEDIQIAHCLNFFNVYKGDVRDPLKRERFLVNQPEIHLFNQTKDWYHHTKYYYTKDGLECCSNYSIAFHYILGENQYRMYFFNYRLRTFGIIRRFPLPPKKKNFIEIAEQLNRERFVKSKDHNAIL